MEESGGLKLRFVRPMIYFGRETMRNIKRIALFLLAALIIALPAQAASGVIQFSASDSDLKNAGFAGSSQQSVQSEKKEETLQIPTATLSPEAAALPWNLTLVNSTHPVPDNWVVTLKELSNGRRIDERIYADLQAMFDAARAAGLTPKVNTAYRTYEDQKDMLVTKYRQQRNNGLSHEDAQIAALKWASYPGYSEHQLGLAVDIVSGNQEVCTNDQVWAWLAEYCDNYGFILRYPQGKEAITGISYEPWHFRYVGIRAAKIIMDEGLTLEEYLEIYYDYT